MSNDVFSKLTVLGPKPSLYDLVHRAKGFGPLFYPQGSKTKSFERQLLYLDLHQFLPVPIELCLQEYHQKVRTIVSLKNAKARDRRLGRKGIEGCDALRDWFGKNWGTDYVMCEESPQLSKNSATFELWSGWDPPLAGIKGLSNLYPDLTFIISFGAEIPSPGRFVFEDGIEVDGMWASEEDDPTYCRNDEEDEDCPDLTPEQLLLYDKWRSIFLESHEQYIATYESRRSDIRKSYRAIYKKLFS
jgi:hypothetical protein